MLARLEYAYPDLRSPRPEEEEEGEWVGSEGRRGPSLLPGMRISL